MRVKQYYHEFINWIENGDILLPVILVAVVHYAVALALYDYWFVAASVGLLVDISHYRVVKLYYAGKPAFWAIVLTVWSFFMHLFYYYEAGAGLWAIPFATTIPLVIFCLGWITKTQRLDEKMARIVSRESHENSDTRDGNSHRVKNSSPVSIVSNGNSDTRNENLETVPIVSTVSKVLRKYDPDIVRQIMTQFQISKSTAYRNYEKYKTELEKENQNA